MKMKTDWPSSLTDEELDELDDYFRRQVREGEGRLLLDGVHGLLSAIAIGPVNILPAEWLPEVLHEPFSNEDEGNRVLVLLAKLNDSIQAELDIDAYEPILGEVDSDPLPNLSAAGWCEGFSRGIDLRACLWEGRLNDDSALMEALGPLMALAVDEGVLSTDVEFDKLGDEEYEQCLAQLPAVLVAVNHYWSEHPVTAEELEALASSVPTSSSQHVSRHRSGHWLH